MSYKEFKYMFTIETDRKYSENLDKWFYLEDEYEWSYDVSEEDIAKAFIKMFGNRKNTLKQNVESVVQTVMDSNEITDMLKEYGVSTVEQAIDFCLEHEKNDAYTLLDSLLGDICYYADKYEEDLNEYFYDRAYDDFVSQNLV